MSLVFRDEQKATGYFRDPALTKAYTEHWFYNGENPIAFGGGEHDSWMRDIYIRNANHAIRVDDQGTRNITLMNIVLDQFAGRSMMAEGQTDGHMGIKLGSGSQHCLVHNVLITGKLDHDICPMGTRDSVFSRIRGENLELDHHAMGNSQNLFTEIDTGIGGRGYGEHYNN